MGCDHRNYDDYFEVCEDCGMTGEQQVQELIGRKVVKTGTYTDGYWLELDNGVKAFIDQ